MRAYDLEEQEQLAELKAWWKQYGNLLLTAVTVVLAAFALWNGWNWYQRWNATQAAGYYDTLQRAARSNDLKAARDAAGTILEKFPGTAYASLAAMVSAKVHLQNGDLKTAKAQLQWAVDHARSDEVKAIAQLRLASVLMDSNELEEALRTVATAPSAGFEGLFAALRGDILLAQKKSADARAAYKSALEKVDPKDLGLREALQLKLDSLGEG